MTTIVTPPTCEVHLFHSPRPLRIVPHHIQPLGMGGPDVPANIVHVCDTGHFNIHRLLDDLLADGTMRRAGTRKEHALAQQGYDAWVAAGKPGRPVYELPQPVRVDHPRNTVVLLPEFHSPHGGRLGRHVNHDPRSWNYRVQRQATPLRSVRHHRRVGIYDQGQLGSCVPHAGKGVLSTAPFTRRFTSERGIVTTYEQLTAMDDVPGQYPPDDTGSDGLSFAKLAVSKRWCSSYLHAFTIDEALSALQTTPLMIGSEWLEGMDTPDDTGQVQLTGGVRGGHEYEADELAIRGTVPDIHEDLVWFDNSWGLSFGLRGRFCMTVYNLAELLARQGDVTVLVR